MPFCFTGCGDDDEPENYEKVIGTWVGLDYDHFYHNVTITFNSDGTGSATLDHDGAYHSYRRAEFTYKIKGNKVTTNGSMGSANSDGETEVSEFNNTYEVKGNVLYVVGGSEWYMNNVQSYTNPDKPAAGNDDDDDSQVASNPMVGKTIRCKGSNKSAYSSLEWDNSFTFETATKFTQRVYWVYKTQDFNGNWNVDDMADLTHEGTYTYSPTQIECRYNDGGKAVLTKQGRGWKNGNDLYE